MRYVIYVMIGIGISIGMEVRDGKDLSTSFKIVSVFAWPIVVSSFAWVHLLPKKESKDAD